jgi:hypothetical protein
MRKHTEYAQNAHGVDAILPANAQQRLGYVATKVARTVHCKRYQRLRHRVPHVVCGVCCKELHLQANARSGANVTTGLGVARACQTTGVSRAVRGYRPRRRQLPPVAEVPRLLGCEGIRVSPTTKCHDCVVSQMGRDTTTHHPRRELCLPFSFEQGVRSGSLCPHVWTLVEEEFPIHGKHGVLLSRFQVAKCPRGVCPDSNVL